jgi:hypothetical protein
MLRCAQHDRTEADCHTVAQIDAYVAISAAPKKLRRMLYFFIPNNCIS